MKKKNIGIWAITLIIAGLMIASTSVAVTMKENTDKGIVVIPTMNTCTKVAESFAKQKEPLVHFSTEDKYALGVDFPIFSFAEVDSQNPAVTTDRLGNVLVTAEIVEDISMTTLFGRWSTDNGFSWVDYEEVVGWQFDDACEKPKLDYLGTGKAAWGTIAPGYDDGIVRYIEYPDMADPTVPSTQADGWTAWYVDWSDNGIAGFDSADVACYSDESNIPNPEFFGVIALTGNWMDDENTIIFSFFVEGGGVRIIGFNIEDEMDCNKVSAAIDQSTGRFYIMAEYENNQEYEDGSYVLYRDITADEDWWRGSWHGYIFEGLLNTDIVAGDGSAYIVGDADNGGQRDIVCFYSSNNGASFTDSMVTEYTAEDEVFPSVAIVKGDAICSYIKDNNLCSSTFDGFSWSSLDQINDEEGTVVDQHSGMNVDGPFVVWTDSRVEPFAVYFDSAVESSTPIIEIKSISGGIGVSAVITNTGTADATDVDYTITATGGILGKINKEVTDTISSLAIDAEETIKLPMLIGLGKVSITVTVGSASETVQGTQILVYTMI